MRLPIFGGAYKGPSVEANPQECVNYIAEADKEGGENSLVIRPGLTETADLSEEELKSEIISNGDFDTSSDWTLDAKWSIGGGKLTHTAGAADDATQAAADMDGSLTEGVTYRLTFDVSGYSGGYLIPKVGDTNGTPVNSNGSHSMNIVSGSGSDFVISASSAFAGSIDSVSLKEIVIPPDQMRGAHFMGNYLYVVHGDQLKQLDSDFASTTLTSSTNKLSTRRGAVTMAHINNLTDGYQLMICDGTTGVAYIYDTTDEEFTRITEADHEFYGGGTVTSQDGYFISNRPGTNDFYISTNENGLEWDVTDVHSAEVKTSSISRVLSAFQNLWVFKENSTEQFYDSGADPVFQRSSIAMMEIGLAAIHSVAILDNAVAWLADDKTVRVSRGGDAQIVSTYHITRRIERMTTISDAVGFGFEVDNHTLYVLTFPQENTTLVYDFSNGIWYDWKSFIADGAADDGRYRANCFASFNNQDIVGDYNNNKLYKIDPTVYADDGYDIRRVRAFRLPKQENKNIFINELEIDINSGSGITTGQGSDPQAMLQISRDGGKTFGNEIWADIGKIGKYKTGVIYRRLGMSENTVFRHVCSEPIKEVLTDAYVDIEVGYA